MKIRNSNHSDWGRIIEIYNEAIETGYSTADTSPVTVESKANWLSEHNDENYPIYVEESERKIKGWCSISPYRSGRMALRHTAEISYYVAREYLRQGVASRLIDYAIKDAENLGIRTLFGVLLDTNEVSIKLLEKFGFKKWGHMPDIADFDGIECGHIYMGKRIN